MIYPYAIFKCIVFIKLVCGWVIFGGFSIRFWEADSMLISDSNFWLNFYTTNLLTINLNIIKFIISFWFSLVIYSDYLPKFF